MKVKFLKHEVSFFTAVIIVSAMSIALIGTSFIDFSNMWGLCAVGAALLFALLYIVFIDKKISSTVIFSEEGIEYKSFKKSILFIAWGEITEITRTPRGINFEWLTFVSNDKRIDVDLTKKMYKVIMILCPYQNQKTKINDIVYRFDPQHRDNNE